MPQQTGSDIPTTLKSPMPLDERRGSTSFQTDTHSLPSSQTRNTSQVSTGIHTTGSGTMNLQFFDTEHLRRNENHALLLSGPKILPQNHKATEEIRRATEVLARNLCREMAPPLAYKSLKKTVNHIVEASHNTVLRLGQQRRMRATPGSFDQLNKATRKVLFSGQHSCPEWDDWMSIISQQLVDPETSYMRMKASISGSNEEYEMDTSLAISLAAYMKQHAKSVIGRINRKENIAKESHSTIKPYLDRYVPWAKISPWQIILIGDDASAVNEVHAEIYFALERYQRPPGADSFESPPSNDVNTPFELSLPLSDGRVFTITPIIVRAEHLLNPWYAKRMLSQCVGVLLIHTADQMSLNTLPHYYRLAREYSYNEDLPAIMISCPHDISKRKSPVKVPPTRTPVSVPVVPLAPMSHPLSAKDLQREIEIVRRHMNDIAKDDDEADEHSGSDTDDEVFDIEIDAGFPMYSEKFWNQRTTSVINGPEIKSGNDSRVVIRVLANVMERAALQPHVQARMACSINDGRAGVYTPMDKWMKSHAQSSTQKENSAAKLGGQKIELKEVLATNKAAEKTEKKASEEDEKKKQKKGGKAKDKGEPKTQILTSSQTSAKEVDQQHDQPSQIGRDSWKWPQMDPFGPMRNRMCRISYDKRVYNVPMPSYDWETSSCDKGHCSHDQVDDIIEMLGRGSGSTSGENPLKKIDENVLAHLMPIPKLVR